MQITKLPQSNFLIEKDNTRILIDPGFLTFEKYKPEDFGKLDTILITHQHPDHLGVEPLKYWCGKGVPVYGNLDVVSQFEEEDLKILQVENGKKIDVADFEITPTDLPHAKLLFCPRCGKTLGADVTEDKTCKFHPKDIPEQVAGPPNTGFLIDKIFFHSGDGLEISGFQVENAGIPIAGPTINFEKAWKFASSLNLKRIIPMHYSNPVYSADPEDFAKENQTGIEVKILNDGESCLISEGGEK